MYQRAVVLVHFHTGEGKTLPTYGSTSSLQTVSSLLRTEFRGIWSIVNPNCFSPPPRSGHFTVYSQETHTCYIGYGISNTDTIFSDLWAFNSLKLTWREIPLTGDQILPRSGSKADLYGNLLIIFGGYSQPDYFSDLHVIDVTTGIRTRVQTNGEQPEPRSSSIIQAYNNKIFIWGGFNGHYPSDLSVLDMSTRTWAHYPQEVEGRSAVAACLVGNELYCYGSHRSNGLVIINLNTNSVRIAPTFGSEPNSSVTGAGMIKADHFLFFFGGKSRSDYTLLYALDLTKLWWFIFHLTPDGKTVSIADGNLSDIGLFMVPKMFHFSMFYDQTSREIFAFLGQPEKDPPPVAVLKIGEALGSLHIRDDLLDMIHLEIQEE